MSRILTTIDEQNQDPKPKDAPCRRRRRPRGADAATSLGAEEADTAVDATPTCAPPNQEPVSRAEPRKKAPLKGHGGEGRNPYPEGGRRGGGGGGRRWARRPRHSCRRRRRRLRRWRGEAWWVLLRAVLGRRPGKIRGEWNRVELSSLRLLARGDWCCLFCLFLLSFDPLL